MAVISSSKGCHDFNYLVNRLHDAFCANGHAQIVERQQFFDDAEVGRAPFGNGVQQVQNQPIVGFLFVQIR